MKTTSKLLASLSLSLLTLGTMAQTPAKVSKARNLNPKAAHGRYLLNPHSTHRTTSIGNYLLDNLNGDAFNTGQTFYNWQPFMFVNSSFNNTDTLGTYEVNDITTTFDTAFDDYTASFTSLTGYTVFVDTIGAIVHYYNSSGVNDTIFFSVNSVTAAGYPGTTVYGVDTAIIPPGFFLYNNIDSSQYFSITKSIQIPITARHGWNFCIKMSVGAPKTMDSIAVEYFSQGATTCAAVGGYYTPEPTTIGVPNGAVNAVNTFADGYWLFNSPGYYGNGTSLNWPVTSGTYQGLYLNSGTYYFAPFPLVLQYPTCTGDTEQWSAQDIGIFPSISVLPTGISKLASAGLTVNQNYPNPFNQTTQITYSLVNASDVVFSVNDITGRELVNNSYGSVASGSHVITLSANSFSPGVYFYTFNINGNKVTKKMVITE